MRKLAIAAGAFSAAVFAANYILPQEWLLFAALCFAVSAAALVLARRKWLRGLILALLFFAAGLLCWQINFKNTAARAMTYSGESRLVRAELRAYPEVYEGYCRMEVRLMSGELPRLNALVYDNGKDCSELRPGDRIEFTGTLKPADTVYGESYDRYYSRGIYLKINAEGPVAQSGSGSRLRYLPVYISHALSLKIEKLFPDDTAPFMAALLLGDKSRLYEDEALDLALSRAGFMHIVAVSGMHVAFLVGLLRCLLGAGRRSALGCMGLVWTFVLVAGAPPSAVRAGFMQSLLLMAPVLRRENDPPTSLALVLAIILLENPYAVASISLQLSFAAMAGILCFSGRIYGWFKNKLPGLERSGLLRYICANISTSLGVVIFTLPLTAVHFGYVSLLSALSNILGLWAVSLCFCGGWAACALSLLPHLGAVAAWLCAWPARYILLTARLISALPFAVVYSENGWLGLWIAVAYAVFILCAVFKKNFWLRIVLPGLATVLGLCVMLHYVNRDYAKGRDTFAVINVGQGLCAVAMAGEDTVMVDCGGINSLENAGELAGCYLLSRGRDTVDAVILTHLHEDHINGLPMLMEMVEVERIIIPSAAGRGKLLDKILDSAALHGTVIEYTGSDGRLEFGGIGAALYAPGSGGAANERCMAVRLSLGAYDALITGDSPLTEERRLAREHDLGGTELLVVGHHGSANAGSELLLNELGGDTAVISVGFNHFGHPAEETLERLSRCAYTVYRTDMDGTVEIRIG